MPNTYPPLSQKGVLLINPLKRIYSAFFKKGTIHLAVVDPMAGSDQRPLITMKDDYLFVGPDNRILIAG
ncbi:MAG: hypothetical protein C0392_10300 [Syntrophus sp. (in: bacteria)]|nr:hypothetical protein [Syntrophus sp. (in: bacteria)]